MVNGMSKLHISYNLTCPKGCRSPGPNGGSTAESEDPTPGDAETRRAGRRGPNPRGITGGAEERLPELGKTMENAGYPLGEPRKTHGKPWKTMENHGKPWKTHGKPMENNGKP